MNSIREIWEKLETEAGNQIVREQIVINSAECYAALNGMTGVRMLQITIIPGTVTNQHIRQFRGVGIHIIPEVSGKAFFTILLLDNELFDIFTLFADDLLDKLTLVMNTEEIPAVIYNRINFWRQLFAKTTGELLSAEQQQGLFGELYFLEWLIDHQKNPLFVIDSWQGSSGSAQDFQWNNCAAEIKTSKALHPQILVSNEQQLDFTLFDKLFLGMVIVFESRGSQQSLLTIIQRIRKQLHHIPETRDLFDLKISQSGITPSLEQEYDKISFTVRDLRFFEVRDNFPVLIRKTIGDEAIHHVTYQIDSNALTLFNVSEEQFLTEFL
jgi:hypothetical protein